MSFPAGTKIKEDKMKQKTYRYYSTRRPIRPGTIPPGVKPLECSQ